MGFDKKRVHVTLGFAGNLCCVQSVALGTAVSPCLPRPSLSRLPNRRRVPRGEGIFLF